MQLITLAHADKFYWEVPNVLSPRNSRFLNSASGENIYAAVWQEVLPYSNRAGGITYISAAFYADGEWSVHDRISPAIRYETDIPSIATVTVGHDGTILIAVLKDIHTITIYKSIDKGYTFSQNDIMLNGSDFITPYLSTASDGGYLLFISRGKDEKFSFLLSRSSDGIEWSGFSEFISENAGDRIFLLTHAGAFSRDIIVFQSLEMEKDRSSYQLYSAFSSNGGKTFSEPKKITSGQEYQNQRPHICAIPENEEFLIVWESSKIGSASENSFINAAVLDKKGFLVSKIKEVFKDGGKSFNPVITLLNGSPYICWTHEYNGLGNIFIKEHSSSAIPIKIRTAAGSVLFARPYSIDGALEIIWQEGSDKKQIMHIKPDHSIKKPALTAVEFGRNKTSAGRKLAVKIKFPHDSSGIAGYSYVWSKDAPPEDVPNEIQKLTEESTLYYEPEEDGRWYVGVKIADYAGNWSPMSVIACELDTIPPAPPDFESLSLDKKGFLPSNTFRVKWKASEFDINGMPESEIEGYTWRVEKIDSSLFSKFKKENEDKINDEYLQKYFSENEISPSLPLMIKTKTPYLDFANYENGFYRIIVSSIDAAGNIGKSSAKYFALNKYIPYTIIYGINTEKDASGAFNLLISGRGFTQDGNITDVYLDKDGKPPFDMIVEKDKFSIVSDKIISDITIDDLDKGKYRVGVSHPVRGIHFTKEYITVDEMGTVKLGNFNYEYKPSWHITKKDNPFYNFNLYIAGIIIFTVSAMLLFSAAGMVNLAKESASSKNEMKILLTGDSMLLKRKKKTKLLKIKGRGLRFKFVVFTVAIILLVVFILAIPLLTRFSRTQKDLLSNGLLLKIETILESMASGARAYLPVKNILELSSLSNRSASWEDVIATTITGTKEDKTKAGCLFVWATSDKDIEEYIDTKEFILGSSELKNYIKEDINGKMDELNRKAAETIGHASKRISELNNEAWAFVIRKDLKGIERRTEIENAIKQTEAYIAQALLDLGNAAVDSYPKFDPKNLSYENTEYTFYKPVLYRQADEEDVFVHGVVFIKVSIENLLKELDEKQREVFLITIYISIFALISGIICAFILGSIITSPVKRLALHVEMIKNTEDKEKLTGKNIIIKQKDEVGMLGEIINEMTENLSKAASASKDLTIGKEIQKMFIPLDIGKTGHKLTSGKQSDENVDFFGYYEGARGVSGDYFDYIKLDDRHYAVIKCDVAGKGVPAALIMVEVATLFLNYFKDWTLKKDGFKLSTIVSQINDAIETRGFKGRFAAFSLCILDSATGDTYFCNAGDNIINIFDSLTGKMKEIKLKESSAAGVFPSSMVDMKGGFTVEHIKLNAGDVLFLYTDGIEEVKRLFRNEKFQPIVCAEPGLKEGDIHGTHTVGQDGEELGKERVNAIIEAVFAKRVFPLEKMHNPIKNEKLEFDFSDCEGTIEEAVLALVSVEKIFRMYKNSSAGALDTITVDKKIDLFLNKYFKQYPEYCMNRETHNDFEEYILYTNISEDEQYDDLTILGIKKK